MAATLTTADGRRLIDLTDDLEMPGDRAIYAIRGDGCVFYAQSMPEDDAPDLSDPVFLAQMAGYGTLVAVGHLVMGGRKALLSGMPPGDTLAMMQGWGVN